MLSATSQVLIRNHDLFLSGKWLLVNPADSQIGLQLMDCDLAFFHQYYDIYQQSSRAGADEQHYFGAAYPTDVKFDGVVIYMPKSKEQLKMLVANASACLKAGGNLMLVGENKGGIKSGAKQLEVVGSSVNKLDSARHCALFACQNDKPITHFDISQWQSVYSLSVADVDYKVCSLPGVFNHGSLDIGTRLLLENLPNTPKGRVLDFGCGAGVIGCFLGLKDPEYKVVMSDVSALAIYCAKNSAELNGIQVDVVASNGLTNITGKFSAVYTNPPFHTGIQTDYSVTEGFIQQLNKFIASTSSLVLVANKFLRYSELLEKRFQVVNLIEQTSKFSLYHCSRVK